MATPDTRRADATETAPPPPAQAMLEQFTGKALAYAWRLLIPTFGLSLIYVNLHFAIRYMGGVRAFSPFGQFLRFSPPTFQELFVWVEIIAMIVLNFLALTAALLCFVVLASIVWAVTNPTEATVIFGSAFINSVRGIF